MGEKMGHVIVPAGAEPWPHEMRCARALAASGRDVEFLPLTVGEGAKSADIQMDGIVWEIKSPETSSLKSLQRVLRRAGHQSSNVIIDTTRATKLSDASIVRELERLAPLTKSIRRLVVITKSNAIIDVKRSRA